ncbi:MAG: hypothetical protein ACRYGF_04615 [Janthinobacterium lividum]
MKPHLALACIFVASPMFAQQTGVSRPPDVLVEDLPAPVPASKPSAAVPANVAMPATAPAASDVYQPYRPELTLHTRTEVAMPSDPDATVVTSVPRRPHELPAGTMLRMRLRQAIATNETLPNTPFQADLSENVESDGRVVLPAGSIVEGTVTHVRGGKRIRGTALIHLHAQAIVFPDGSRIPLNAEVIDTDQYANTRVDEEGNILRKDHVGATLAAMSLTTGGAAAAGAVIGGGVGAVVGAGIGAGVSTAWWLKQDRQTHLPKDTLVVLGLTEPLAIQSLVREPEFSAVPSQAIAPAPAGRTYAAELPEYKAPQSFVPAN